MRERVLENVNNPGSYLVKTVDTRTGQLVKDATYVTRGDRYSDVMLDVVTPNFHKLTAAGFIFNNPMSRSVFARSGGVGMRRAIRTNDTEHSTATGNIVQLLSQLDGVGHLPNLVDTSGGNALLNAFANVDSTPYEFGEDLAELRESIEYIRKPFQAFAKALLPYRRKRDKLVKKGLSIAKAHSKAWLEYRFALVPMATSAYNAGDAMCNWKKRVMPVRMTSRGFHNSKYSRDGKVESGYRTYWRTIESKCSTRATVLYERPGGQMSVAHTLGVRAKDIPAVLWAVAPYSWLIDRFVDMSALVNAYVNLFDPKVRYLLACESQTIETTSQLQIALDTTPGWVIGHSNTPEKIVTREYNRVPKPTNDVSLPVPTMVALKSVSNLTDIAALALQRLR